ncbi:MAG: sigma 54-interacting transcriptional regulator [Acidobacteriota bacterium]
MAESRDGRQLPRGCGERGDPVAPLDSERFMTEVAQRVERLAIEEWGLRKSVSIVGLSPAVADVHRKLEKIAAFDAPVLISGESGVGKEALAQAIYLLGSRRGKPFVAVNCPQYQEGNLTVSELFGHKKGSFTGAVADRKGCFEVADGGVIFLDEIGDLHMAAQTMLLRALAYGEFQPLGSQQTKTVNVRVVAATNRSLDQLRMGDHFRDDLFFRLHYFHIRIPPLRDRGDDWLILVDYFLAKLSRQHGVAKRFSQASLKILSGYDWPGNIRELNGIVTMGYALCDGEQIEPHDFLSLLQSRQAAAESQEDELYWRVVVGGESFWKVVHAAFIARELNRGQVRTVIRRGLTATDGSYQQLLEHFHLPSQEYQKFMDFLRHHRLKP